MRSSLVARLPLAALASLFGVVVGCNSTASTAPAATSSSRILTGSVRTSAYALDNAVAMAVSSDGRRFVGAVQVDGSFRVTVPTGISYRLALANTLATGGFNAIAAISWTSAARTAWMHVDGAGELALGVVRPSGNPGLTTESQGGAGGGADDGSDAGGGSESGGGKGGGANGGGGDDGSGDKSEADGGDDDDGAGDDDTRECRHGKGAEADLPYDVQPQLGSTFTLTEAFLFKGPLPAAVLGVTMDSGSTWRLTELTANTPFVTTQADCDHVGNRATGRDRIEVTWQNADGSTKTDHLDLRYCDPSGSRATPPTAPPPAVTVNDDCEDDHPPVCASGPESASECDGDKSMGTHADDATDHDGADDDQGTACPTAPPSGGGSGVSPSPTPPSGGSGGGSGTTPPSPTPPSGGGSGAAPSPPSGGGSGAAPSPTPPPGAGTGGACTVNADCATGLACIASTCAPRAIP